MVARLEKAMRHFVGREHVEKLRRRNAWDDYSAVEDEETRRRLPRNGAISADDMLSSRPVDWTPAFVLFRTSRRALLVMEKWLKQHAEVRAFCAHAQRALGCVAAWPFVRRRRSRA